MSASLRACGIDDILEGPTNGGRQVFNFAVTRGALARVDCVRAGLKWNVRIEQRPDWPTSAPAR
ncbi:hypothetical protein Q4F19_08645 [Sphingomonas sp. BIUV-7]|uniref:Uncharacterized protein n=1 Tax=Sphingomonas natans TaxID=3063330 RepID=A0ABT8Y803_9SPHN|nr:hypothetical protein [Sphingomonas sp. BIUV-7]MDO6414445.1 hypothetical protein [Sphingomonas sp. BIUV-7]